MRGLNRVLAGTLATSVMAMSGTALGHGLEGDPDNLMETPMPATAVAFGVEGQVVISALRVTGLAWTDTTIEDANGNETESFSDIELSFFGGPQQNAYSVQVAAPLAAVDYFVIPQLSVGVGVAFIFGKPKTNTVAGDRDNIQVFGFTGVGRVGYAFNVGDVVTLWPHVGMSGAYTKHDEEEGANATTKRRTLAMWANVDVTILARAGEGYGFTFVPEVAIPVLGHVDDGGGHRLSNYSAWVTGATLGLSVWF